VILLAWVVAAGLMVALVSPPDPSGQEARSFLPENSPFSLAMAQFEESFPDHAGLSWAIVIFERRDGKLTSADRAVIHETARRILRPADGDSHRDDLVGVRVQQPADYAPLPWQPSLGLPRNPLVSPITPDGQAAILRVQIPANYITTQSARVVEHIRDTLRELQDNCDAGVSPVRPVGILPASDVPLTPNGEDDLLSSDDQANGTHNAGETPAPHEAPTPHWPAGLAVAVTGSSGVGFDYAAAARASERRTLVATLIAVSGILLLVYRSPLAAAVPLVCISLAAIVVTRLLSLGHYAGLHVGLAESIFVVVLIYGAGVDYSLLLISRFREYVEHGLPTETACGRALRSTLPAIAAAAAINIFGLFMLAFARFGIFRTTGPAVAVALCVALAAALTLLPACVGVLGGRLFWPARLHPGGRPSRAWGALAGTVTRRPGLVLGVTLVVLVLPAAMGVRQEWAYDTLAALKPREIDGVGNSARGAEIAQRHWPIGELAPVETLVKLSHPLTPAQWTSLTQHVRDNLRTLRLSPPRRDKQPPPAIVDIRSLADPLGLGQPLPRLGRGESSTGPSLLSLIPGAQRLTRIDTDIQRIYLSADHRATYMELILATQPFERQALDAVGEIHRQSKTATEQALRALGLEADVEVFLAGPTAEMAATRDVTQRDFYLVAGLALGVILVMILALLRDLLLALWMLGSTILSYFATLGLCSLIFVTLGNASGLDWKLEIFLFVVMVAVGQDYNIFLATRLVQERAGGLSVPEAARRAMTFTGPVISSCGLIMAATLGSLVVGELALLVQLGFAMALGMLIDTFLVRPLLLPAFCCLTGRTGKPSRWVH